MAFSECYYFKKAAAFWSVSFLTLLYTSHYFFLVMAKYPIPVYALYFQLHLVWSNWDKGTWSNFRFIAIAFMFWNALCTNRLYNSSVAYLTKVYVYSIHNFSQSNTRFATNHWIWIILFVVSVLYILNLAFGPQFSLRWLNVPLIISTTHATMYHPYIFLLKIFSGRKERTSYGEFLLVLSDLQ